MLRIVYRERDVALPVVARDVHERGRMRRGDAPYLGAFPFEQCAEPWHCDGPVFVVFKRGAWGRGKSLSHAIAACKANMRRSETRWRYPDAVYRVDGDAKPAVDMFGYLWTRGKLVQLTDAEVRHAAR